MNLKDLIAKMTAIEEGQYFDQDEQLPQGYTRTPQGEIMPPNPAGQRQAAGNAQDQADLQRMSDWTFQQATKNPPKHISNAQAQQQAAQMDKVWEDGDEQVEECGDTPMIAHEVPKQPDNVTMNVSMNGQGASGIRDLMNILRNLDKEEQGHEEPIMGNIVAKMKAAHDEPEIEIGEEMGDDAETYGNSVQGDAGSHVHGIDAVTASGNDMNSKGKASPLSTAPGTNPLRGPVQEGLVDRLSNLYNEVKSR